MQVKNQIINDTVTCNSRPNFMFLVFRFYFIHFIRFV